MALSSRMEGNRRRLYRFVAGKQAQIRKNARRPMPGLNNFAGTIIWSPQSAPLRKNAVAKRSPACENRGVGWCVIELDGGRPARPISGACLCRCSLGLEVFMKRLLAFAGLFLLCAAPVTADY